MNIQMILRVAFARLPAFNNWVYFTSFDGLYNDNPLAISKALHDANPNIQIFWLIKDKSKEKENIPKYIKVIPHSGIKNTFISSVAKIVVNNGVGLCYTFTSKNKAWLYGLLKNKHQYDISTWHGTPIKKIGSDCLKNKDGIVCITNCDMLVLGNKYSANTILSTFVSSIPVALYGTPRNDKLVNIKSEKVARNIKINLGLPLDKKIILYAPTFRDHVFRSESKTDFDYLMNLDVDRLIAVLSAKFGGEWAFVFRGHQFVDKYIDQTKYSTSKTHVYDGNLHDDMSDYLLTCDVLLTDYSASAFDYSLTRRPCFLYCPDIDYYANIDRGLYDVIYNMPYKVCSDNDELIACIEQFEQVQYQNQLELFFKKYGVCETGESSEKTAQLINRLISSNKRVSIKNEIQNSNNI